MLLDFDDVRRILIVGCDMHACDELIVNVKWFRQVVFL